MRRSSVYRRGRGARTVASHPSLIVDYQAFPELSPLEVPPLEVLHLYGTHTEAGVTNRDGA